MIIEKKKISDLIPAPYNPRQSTAKQEKHLKESLEKFGLVEPIIFNKQTGYIVGGHFRVRELKKLGISEIECVIVDLNEADEKELNIRLNANTGGWDWDTLANDWDVVDLEAWGLEIPQFDTVEELEASEDDYEVPEGGMETDIVIGDLFEIGEHRLLCGDSTDSDAVARLMNGEKADMVFTDPPYGINYSGGRTQVVKNKTYGKLMNDDLQGVELGELISNVFQFNKQDADVYICVSPKMQKPFLDFIEANNKEIDAVIVWDKKQAGLGYMAYRRQCEFILFVKGGAFKKGDNTDFDLWSINRDNGQDYQHGTQKPIAVPSRAINNSSKKDDLVLDYFLGSGSTMVAAHQLKRKCYGMELEPKYCAVIIDRMRKLDSSLIIKRNGKQI
jgi:DNA modification methylase